MSTQMGALNGEVRVGEACKRYFVVRDARVITHVMTCPPAYFSGARGGGD